MSFCLIKKSAILCPKPVNWPLFQVMFLLLPCMWLSANNEDTANRINEVLTSGGFRNVATVISGDSIFLTFENYDYRFESDAIKAVLVKTISVLTMPTRYKVLILLPQKNQVPVIAVVVSLNRYNSRTEDNTGIDNTMDDIYVTARLGGYQKKLINIPGHNSLISNIDIEVKPQLRLQLGDYDYPVKYQFCLLPAISTSLWKGMHFTYQLVIPALTYHYVDKYNFIRPGIITISQLFRLPEDILSAFTLGYFTRNRYGLDFEIGKYFINQRFFCSVNSGYTGNAEFIQAGSFGSSFEYGEMNYFTYRTSINYIIPKYAMVLNVTAGKYLYHQKAVEAAISRHFNEYFLSLNASLTNEGTNFGVSISVPLYPAKYSSNKKIRIRPSECFNYSYLAARNFTYYYETEENFYSWIKNFDTYFVKYQLKQN